MVLSGRSGYAPSIGAALLVGAALAWLAATRLRPVLPIASAVYLGACGWLTWREVPVWRSSASAIDAAAARGPESYWVPMTRAYRARDMGSTIEALKQFRLAADLIPFDTEMLSDGAALALAQGDTAAAMRWLRTAVTVNPRARRARTRLISILDARGDARESRRLIEDGLRAEPDQHIWALRLEATR